MKKIKLTDNHSMVGGCNSDKFIVYHPHIASHFIKAFHISASRIILTVYVPAGQGSVEQLWNIPDADKIDIVILNEIGTKTDEITLRDCKVRDVSLGMDWSTIDKTMTVEIMYGFTK